MSTYTVTDPTTNKSVDLEGDSPPTEDELNQIFSQVHGTPTAPSYSAKDAIGDVARPLLEGGGAAAGGLLASPLGPIAAAGGGALGFAAGKAGADLLDRGLGRKPLLQSVPQAIGEAGSDLYSGAKAEGTGLAVAGLAKPILKGAASLRNMAGSWATGVPAEDFQTVANHPEALIPGSLKKAGQNFGQEAAKAGISSDLTPEAVDRIRSPGQYAFDTFNKLKTEGTITPQEALHARQSVDAIYPIPNQKNGAYIRTLDEIRSAFQNVITNASPGLKEASKDYAIAKAGSQFQSILPRNKSGTPSFLRGAAMISGLAEDEPTTMFMSPAVAGVATAASGKAGSVVKNILGNPTVRRGVVGGATSLFQSKPQSQSGFVNPSESNPEQLDQTVNNGEPQEGAENPLDKIVNQGKTLTREIAKKFLDLANGSKDLARELARKAGYSW